MCLSLIFPFCAFINMKINAEPIYIAMQNLRSAVIFWSVRNPGISLCCIILLTGAMLPLISATALMPIVFLFELSDYLAARGVIFVTYMILWQGLILGFLIIILYFAAFLIGSSATVLHNYNVLNWEK